jgi:hypothetical protein
MSERGYAGAGLSNLPLLRKASKICYATGIYLIASIIASFVVALIEIAYIFSSFPYPANVDSSSFLVVNLVISCIAVSFSLLFGYYTFKVGDAYKSTPLKAGGVLYFFMSVLSTMVVVVSTVSSTSVSLVSTTLPITFAFSLLVSFITLGLTLAAYICLIIGALNMKNKTGVESFNTAMILFILFFIPFVFPVGFGS